MNHYATPHRVGVGQTAAVRGGRSRKFGMPFLLVFAALTFNFVLCFVNTNLFGISRAHVVGVEIIIIGLALLVSYRVIGQNQIILITAMILYLMILSSIRSLEAAGTGIDIKVIRDFLIPIAFFLLGTRCANLAAADSTVRICAVVVTAFAIFEYFFLETYLHYFNISSYYISRGSLESDQIEWLTSNLYVSGIRPEGRTLFPFLGDHRVSTVFLEPVSPGNFAVTLFLWALVRSTFERKFYFGTFLMAVFLTIMADNRFGAFICVAAIAGTMMPSRYLRVGLIFAPFVVIAALLGVRVWYPDAEIDNTLGGRILSSAYTLGSLDIWNWLGVGTIADFATTDADSGYAYTISRIGILGFAMFWGLFTTLRSTNGQFEMFRVFCALYFAAILVVSYSPYTIKTAGLMWFLLGVLWMARRNSWVPVRAAGAAPVAAARHDYGTSPSR